MFRFLQKSIAKVVAWGIRKIGGWFPEIKEKLNEYGISMTDKPIKDTVIQAVDEIDVIGEYANLDTSVGIPASLILETKEKLQQNYLSRVQVFWRVPGEPQPQAQIISVLHDYNISDMEIKDIIQRKLDKYAKEYEADNAQIVHMERIAVLHHEGSDY